MEPNLKEIVITAKNTVDDRTVRVHKIHDRVYCKPQFWDVIIMGCFRNRRTTKKT